MDSTIKDGNHGLGPASQWVVRWSHLIKPKSNVLDVACGHGRHMHYISDLGHLATGMDRSALAIQTAQNYGKAVLADLENGPWPLESEGKIIAFGAVIVTNYLWRPLFPFILNSLEENGILIYETFSQGNEAVGKPSRPDFLLQRNELLKVCENLRVIAFEDGYLEMPNRFVQRIVAVRETNPPAGLNKPPAYLL